MQLRKKLRSNILLVVDDAYDEYIQKIYNAKFEYVGYRRYKT